MNRENNNWIPMKELEKRSGIPRRTIHFYLQTGLLHSPLKTGKTMAYYDETHLRKLEFIKKAKERKLPLIAIQNEIASLEKGNPDAFGKKTNSLVNKSRPTLRGKRPLEQERKETREVIKETASRIFREKGYKNTKISEITKQLGIGKGTFYFYFADKKELFLECVPYIFGELFSKGWNRIRHEENPWKRLEIRAQEVIAVLTEFCAILQLAREAIEDPDPRIQNLGQQIFQSIRKPVMADLEKGIQEGIFRKVEINIVSTLLIGLMESLLYLKKIDKVNLNEETIKIISEFISHGIGADNPVV